MSHETKVAIIVTCSLGIVCIVAILIKYRCCCWQDGCCIHRPERARRPSRRMSRPDEPLVVLVKIPPWAAPGDTLRATNAPSGQSGRFVVPPWAEPGQHIRVELPSVEECAEHELRMRRETAALPESIAVEPTDGGGGDTAGFELTVRMCAVGAAAADSGGGNPTPVAVVPAAAAARPPEPLYPPPAEPADEEDEEEEEEEVPTALACS